jgi:signal transduction histidine kinase
VDIAVDSSAHRPGRSAPAVRRHAVAAAAGLLGVGAVVEVCVRNTGTAAIVLLVLLCVVALSTTLPLALPGPTVAGSTVILATVASLSIFQALTVAGCVAAVAAAYRMGRSGRAVLAVAAVGPYLLITALGRPDVRVIGVLLAALVPAAALTGLSRRTRQDDIANRATREAIAGTLLEHTARGERARIARELHDVVAHHISMVSVQAETARLTTPGLPAIGAQRLAAIGDTARAALTEMRRLLGVLREDAPTGDIADRRPQPGLAQLPDLVDDARDATGAGTRLILHGTPVRLDPGVELAAYRIVQEALTNARRHAPGAAVDVELHFTPVALRVLIRDNGPGPAGGATAHRHGLLGMRERAAAVGGDVRTGAARTGGFLVEASLPTDVDRVPAVDVPAIDVPALDAEVR